MSDRTAGASVLLFASAGVGTAVFVYSRDAFVLLVWALGAAAVWYMARTPNPAPPPPPEGDADEKPQFTLVQDPTHPNRWMVRDDKEGTD